MTVMDDFSAQYLSMANGPQEQLHDPAAVVNFVEQMQLVVERSSAPRRNFLLDTTTPRGDVIITEASALKPGNGWITLQVTEGIRRGVHEWCVKIEHQGETTDGSGLMLGVVPKSFAKYDSFISQGGGWCLSRAGKFYGHWRRQDSSSSVVFGTGDRVIFILDYEAARMTVRVGDKSVVGEISNLAPEVYPAISLHYRHQFVRFEYHKVLDRHAKKLNWIERVAFPHASVYLPLTADELEKVLLDSYVFSPLFTEKEGETVRRKRRKDSAAFSMPLKDETVSALREYETPRATSARLTVLLWAIQAVRRYCSGSVTLTEAFLDRNVTAETLREQQHALASRGGSSCSGGMDTALNCGALVLIHMFAHASLTLSGVAMLPLVYNLQDYLRGITLFGLREASTSSQSVGTSLSPEVMRQALDGVANLLDRAYTHDNSNGCSGYVTSGNKDNNTTTLSSTTFFTAVTQNNSDNVESNLVSALSELLVLLSLQRGTVSEVLRAVRYLLRLPTNEVSQATLAWLQASDKMLTPRSHLPNLNEAYDVIEDDKEQLTFLGRDLSSKILSVAYDFSAIYIHTVDGLSKRSNVAGTYTLVCFTCEPRDSCPQCSHSSIACSEAGLLLLLTNRMSAAGLAVVTYNPALEIQQKVALADVPHWPVISRYMALASGPGDRIVLVYDVMTSPPATAAASPSASVNSSSSVGLEIQVFNSSTFPEMKWRTALHATTLDRTFAYCLTLRKGSVIDFGSPEMCLTTVGGHVTVEVWIRVLEKDDTCVFYQHGDRSTSGEVFLETARLEGAWRIRGGYRHDSRGMCVVTAPVSPASESRFLHVALVFDGNWRLYLDSEEVASTKQGAQVLLENPRQRWTAGNDCVCQMAALRVWKGGRSPREIVRDSRRLLYGDEPGLLCQYFFNEQNGNVVYNHVRTGAALGRHAVIRGHFARVGCFDHPLSTSLRNSSLSGASTAMLVSELPQLENTRVFFNGVHLGMIEQRTRTLSGFADWKHVHQVTFFDIRTGRSVHGGCILRHRSIMGFLGCDRSGHYWELFNNTGANSGAQDERQFQPQAVAVGTLSVATPFLRGNNTTARYCSLDTLSFKASEEARELGSDTGNGISTQAHTKKYEEAHYGRHSFFDIHGTKLTFGSLALWLLGLLSSFAEANITDSDNQLFSPLLDDVSIRCVQEVQLLLCEHCRVVKAINARRSANLKDSTSSTVIVTTLQVLVRLIRRVRDFKLHPDTIGLSEVNMDENHREFLHEFNSIRWKCSVSRPNQSGSSTRSIAETPGGNDELMDRAFSLPRRRGSSLLGVLTDIINEAGFNLPLELAELARLIIQEGVTLFFPSAVVRAKLLREILNRDPLSTTRPPALDVLLDAIVKSFTDISSAAALVHAVNLDINRVDMNCEDNATNLTDEKLLVIKTTLLTLLRESVNQMTVHIQDKLSQPQLNLLSGMADAIGTLQLLLFSQCSGIRFMDMNGAGTRRVIESIFSLPLSTCFNPVVKDYYTELFDSAEIIFKTLKREISASHRHMVSAATAATRVINMVGNSFVGSPLHAAVTALPLMVTRRELGWLLQKLNLLCMEYRSLLELININTPGTLDRRVRFPLHVLDNALLLASSWVASFMSLGQLSSGPSGASALSSLSSGDAGVLLQEICDHPLLAAGLQSPQAAIGTTNFSNCIIGKMQEQRSTWEALARRNDPLAARIPAEVGTTMSLAAVAVVYLSGVNLQRLTREELNQLLAKTLFRLRGVRNELLNCRSKSPTDFPLIVRDVQERCKLLLRMGRVSEAEFIKMPSVFLAQSFANRVLRENGGKHCRWRRAVFVLRAQRMYHEAVVNSWPLLQIDSALRLVERIVLPSEVTALSLQAAMQARQAEALQRLEGLRYFLRLFETDTLSALKLSSLLFNGAVGSRLQFETGISGCLDSTRCDIRQTMYNILQHLRDSAAASSSVFDNRRTEKAADKMAKNTSFYLATLSRVLNRNWILSDFCYLEYLGVVRVIFVSFCSIFEETDIGTLRYERATERSHRFDTSEARKQTSTLSGPSEAVDEDVKEVILEPTSQEIALKESLNVLKSLGLQCAKALGEVTISPSDRRGCILFLDGLFDVLEAELCKCAKYAAQTGFPAQERVLDQVSLICTLTSTISRALPEGFFCNSQTCSRLALLAFRFCVMAGVLLTLLSSTTTATTTMTGMTAIGLVDVCIYASTLLLCHCQPATVDALFSAEDTMELTRQAVCVTGTKGRTLGFFFSLVLRCFSDTSASLKETGMRCVDALHILVQRRLWDESFSALFDTFQCDLAAASAVVDEESAWTNSIRLLVWIYALGGAPASLLGLGRKVRVGMDNALTGTEGAYIVDYQAQSNVVTVIPSISSTLIEERDVALDSLINASQEEITLPRADVLFRFLVPLLEFFFKPPVKSLSSPLIWAVVAGVLRITHAVLSKNPSESQVLLTRDIIGHVDNFAFRLAAKVPLPLCYLYEVYPIVVQQLLQSTKRISFDIVVPSPTNSNVAAYSPAGTAHNQWLLNMESNSVFPFDSMTPGSPLPLPPPLTTTTTTTTLFSGGTGVAMGNSIVPRSELDTSAKNNGVYGGSNCNSMNGATPSHIRHSQAHLPLSSTSSILCFSGAKDASCGTLTVKSVGTESCIPFWTDGVTLEMSILLCDRLFPELGEEFVVPSSWQRPDIHFTLFALYEKSNVSTSAMLRVVLTENNIDCIVENAKGMTAVVSAKLLRGDWDHWIYIAVVVESKTLTLYKDGVGTTTVLPRTVGSRLEALLREGGIDRLVLGNETDSSAKGTDHGNDVSVIDSTIVAVDSIRVWGCARPLKAQRMTADFVAREQTLPVVGITDSSQMTFRFLEATGSETLSEDKECVGTLCGNVRWAPFPVFSGSLNLDNAPRTDPTSHADLPLFVPRREFEGFFAALDRVQLLRIGCEYLQSLCAHLSRKCVLAAICQIVSPAYHILAIEKCRQNKDSNCGNGTTNTVLASDDVYANVLPPIEILINPRHVIASIDIVRHLINLLRYSDTGTLPDDKMLAISKFIKLWFRSIASEKVLVNSFRETVFAMGEALQDEAESFRVDLPPMSYVASETQLVPIATLNGPGGTVSFDLNSRGIEHMTLLRDRKQKLLLAKYPDAQGGWPELELPNDSIWFYARPIVSTRNSSTSFIVSVRSLKPLIACSIFGAIRDVLTSHVKYNCGLSYFLNVPFISLLTVRAGTAKSAAMPACRLLTAIFELWQQLPTLSPHDQSPLKILLAHINAPLLAILRRGQISPGSPPPLLPRALGDYNVRIQSAFELLVAAIRLEATWKKVPHNHCTRHRWRRLYSLWERSISYGIPARPHLPVVSNEKEPVVLERGCVHLMLLPASDSTVQQRPKANIFQRYSGVWYASCDRLSLSARSSVGFSRGRFYFEVRIPAGGEPISVGVVTERAQQHSALAFRGLGHDSDSWGFESAQMCRFNHGFRHEFAVRTKWKALDVIGILLDLETGTLACVHDERQVSVFDNLKTSRSHDTATSYFPAVSFGTGGIDVNFGAAPFACSLPIGFLPVDPSNYMTLPISKLWTLLAAVNVGESLADGNRDGDSNSAAFSNGTRRLPGFFEKANEVAMMYQTGRSGPFNVTLLPCDNRTKMVTVQGNEVSAEDDPCFVRGSVCVRKGRWYYEVVLRGDALVGVGWVKSTAAPDWSRTKALGDDADSWVLEGSRTTARHNKHQRSVGGYTWKHGDVVGCMVDCDAGTIAYSVNGTPLREMHDTNGNGVLFSAVNCTNGLMPIVGVDPKNTASIYFSDDDLLFCPRGYCALGTTRSIRLALEQYYCLDESDVKGTKKGKSDEFGPIFSPTLARSLLFSLTALTELNFMNTSAYCIEDVLNKNNSTIRYEEFHGHGNAFSLLMTLQNLSMLTECMIPYAHVTFISGEYDTFLSGPIRRSLRRCRNYALPVVALRYLHNFSLHTNCLGENVKLTLNRRKALSLVKDMNVPVADRLRGSLFGQIYQLLHDKNVSLFCTSKKLWSVNFVGEGADDIGGPYRESITQLCSELMSPGLPLFIPSPNQVNDIGDYREVFVVRPEMEPFVRLSMYHFFGRLIAGCLRSAEPLPIYLPSRIWKALVGDPVDMSDLGMVDKAALQSYQYIRQLTLSNSSTTTTDEMIAELCPGGFSVVDDLEKEQELFSGGKNVSVGQHNVKIFLDMALRFKLHTMGGTQVKAIADGFHQVIPVSAVSLLKWYELEQVVCGQPDYDADVLLDSARYEDLDPNDIIVQYLRQVLRQFSRHERALFMRFVSGRERLPSGVRLKLMPDAYSRSMRDDMSGGNGGGGNGSSDVFDDNRLPHASTCFYWLSIPRYSSVEVMRDKLLFAIQQCLDIDADFVVHENGNAEDEVEPILAVNADEDDEEFEDFSHLR